MMHGEALAGLDAVLLGARDALAVPLGDGEHLGNGEAHREVMVMPSAMQSSRTSRPAQRTGQFHGDVGGPGVQAPGHREHLAAVARAHRVHLGADEARLLGAALVPRNEFLGDFGDGHLHQSFGLLLGAQVLRHNLRHLGGPLRLVSLNGDVAEKRIGGDADGAAIEADLQLGQVGRVVPPDCLRVRNDPIQVCIILHDYPSPSGREPYRARFLRPHSTHFKLKSSSSLAASSAPNPAIVGRGFFDPLVFTSLITRATSRAGREL